jgi:hypothetical protein
MEHHNQGQKTMFVEKNNKHCCQKCYTVFSCYGLALKCKANKDIFVLLTKWLFSILFAIIKQQLASWYQRRFQSEAARCVHLCPFGRSESKRLGARLAAWLGSLGSSKSYDKH